MLIMPCDTDSQSRNVLASPLGEEGHEVAKGCTRVRMIMILDVDVTAEGGIIKLIARKGNPPPFEPACQRQAEPFEPFEPSHRRCVQSRVQHIENHHSCLSRLLNIVTVHDIL